MVVANANAEFALWFPEYAQVQCSREQVAWAFRQNIWKQIDELGRQDQIQQFLPGWPDPQVIGDALSAHCGTLDRLPDGLRPAVRPLAQGIRLPTESSVLSRFFSFVLESIVRANAIPGLNDLMTGIAAPQQKSALGHRFQPWLLVAVLRELSGRANGTARSYVDRLFRGLDYLSLRGCGQFRDDGRTAWGRFDKWQKSVANEVQALEAILGTDLGSDVEDVLWEQLCERIGFPPDGRNEVEPNRWLLYDLCLGLYLDFVLVNLVDDETAWIVPLSVWLDRRGVGGTASKLTRLAAYRFGFEWNLFQPGNAGKGQCALPELFGLPTVTDCPLDTTCPCGRSISYRSLARLMGGDPVLENRAWRWFLEAQHRGIGKRLGPPRIWTELPDAWLGVVNDVSRRGLLPDVESRKDAPPQGAGFLFGGWFGGWFGEILRHRWDAEPKTTSQQGARGDDDESGGDLEDVAVDPGWSPEEQAIRNEEREIWGPRDKVFGDYVGDRSQNAREQFRRRTACNAHESYRIRTIVGAAAVVDRQAAIDLLHQIARSLPQGRPAVRQAVRFRLEDDPLTRALIVQRWNIPVSLLEEIGDRVQVPAGGRAAIHTNFGDGLKNYLLSDGSQLLPENKELLRALFPPRSHEIGFWTETLRALARAFGDEPDERRAALRASLTRLGTMKSLTEKNPKEIADALAEVGPAGGSPFPHLLSARTPVREKLKRRLEPTEWERFEVLLVPENLGKVDAPLSAAHLATAGVRGKE